LEYWKILFIGSYEAEKYRSKTKTNISGLPGCKLRFLYVVVSSGREPG
jgi:hypothetical protein